MSHTALKEEEERQEPVSTLGDGDDGNGDDSTVTTENEKLCTWSDDPDEHRRVFVFDKMADSQIDGRILVENMNHVSLWLKDGVLPASKARPQKA
jgi:hypothetical protein